MLNVVLFASGGDIPISALHALHRAARMVGIVRPGRPRGLPSALRAAVHALRRRAPDALSELARQLGIPEHRARGAADPSLPGWLNGLGADLLCVATFPWRLRDDLLQSTPLGAINVHASLLPRHRGPNPWFWTYHADDRQAGVTVHRCSNRIDAGDILAQRAWPLERGHPVATLHREVAERGAELLGDLMAREPGAWPATPQDETSATRAPRLIPGARMIDASWPVERAWHLLAGTVGQYREPLVCEGRPVRYRSVPGYVEAGTPAHAPGTVEKTGDGSWRLWCRDGFVQLAAAG